MSVKCNYQIVESSYLKSSNGPPRVNRHATQREPKTSNNHARNRQTSPLCPPAEPRLPLSPLSTFSPKLRSTIWFALFSWAAFELCAVLVAATRACATAASSYPARGTKKNTEKQKKQNEEKKHTQKVAGFELQLHFLRRLHLTHLTRACSRYFFDGTPT